MPKPTTKSELLSQSQTNYQNLLELISGYTDAECLKEFPPGTLNRNIRDVLAHLHHWHLLFLSWYADGMKDIKPAMPAKGYTWKTMPDLNKAIWEKYQDVEMSDVKDMLSHSYQEVKAVILKHNEEELFEKKKYKWTGSTSLGAYLIANASSHYKWAYKLIKRAVKKK